MTFIDLTTPIDKALAAALEDKEQAEDFYKLFLNARLYVPIRDSEDLEGNGVQGGETFDIIVFEMDGANVVPVFDTEERLGAWAEGDMAYVVLAGHTIVEILDPSMHVILNPANKQSREFSAEELQWLRSSIDQSFTGPETLEAGTDIRIRRIIEISNDLHLALDQGLTKNQEVRAAYLVEATYDTGADRPHLLLLLDISDSNDDIFEAVARDLSVSVRGVLGSGVYLDFMVLSTGSEIGSIIKEDNIKPLYVRECMPVN